MLKFYVFLLLIFIGIGVCYAQEHIPPGGVLPGTKMPVFDSIYFRSNLRDIKLELPKPHAPVAPYAYKPEPPKALFPPSYLSRTEKKKKWFAPYIVPASLIAYGLSRDDRTMAKIDEGIQKAVVKNVSRQYRFDDYIQYAPIASVFALDLCGVKGRNNLRDRSIVTVTSMLIAGTAVYTIKKQVPRLRPDGVGANSFPSGHTATAFVGAHILYKEYRGTDPWIVVAGYGVATTTGLMRVVNNRHWFSDVVAGAGISMASVEISYLLLPHIKNMFGIDKRKDTGMMFSATYLPKGAGAGMVYVF